MWSRVFVGLSTYQVMLAGFFQADVISPEWFNALREYPILLMFVAVVYYLQKQQREDAKERRLQQKEDNEITREWLEKMLEIQRASLKDTYGGQQQFVSTLLSQIESKQNGMADRIELLTQQLAINTNTVSEIAKVDSIVSELIARLENK